MSDFVPFPKVPYPADSHPIGSACRALIEPSDGGWWLIVMDDGGCSNEGIHSKAEALRRALVFVERFNAELELNNRPMWDRGSA